MIHSELTDCPRCNSAGAIEHGLCQVCLAEYRSVDTLFMPRGAMPVHGEARAPANA